ncbi:Translation initiation factor IF-2, mitochondrial [Nymphon striatum]|nr:Translation initiation factor IF-2, mitochondrial [Nymphon striatum]
MILNHDTMLKVLYRGVTKFSRTLMPIVPVHNSSWNFESKCYIFLNASIYQKKKMKRGPIRYSPKAQRVSKESVDIWKNMTVKEIAVILDRNIDDIYEIMLYVPNASNYDHDNATIAGCVVGDEEEVSYFEVKMIDDTTVISNIIKKLGNYKIRMVPHPVNSLFVKQSKDISKRPPAEPSEMVKRPPVVTIMGHVDHGKTTLLDKIRKSSIVDQEFGGITQHIGAFTVKISNKETITFLDTPGHAAFSAMRARGATVTDIVILVISADDGVMDQTIESIQHAKDADVPIVVAINKIDKPGADIENCKKSLTANGLILEEFGGDVMHVQISALKDIGIDSLIEAVLMQAEMMELKGDLQGLVEGTIIESKLDSFRGNLATVLVQRGTLRKGSILIAGTTWVKVKAMFNENKSVDAALPSHPVEVIGWKDLPSCGDDVMGVKSETYDPIPAIKFWNIMDSQPRRPILKDRDIKTNSTGDLMAHSQLESNVIDSDEEESTVDELINHYNTSIAKQAKTTIDWRLSESKSEKMKKDAVEIQRKADEHSKKYKAVLQKRREEGRIKTSNLDYLEIKPEEEKKGITLSVILKGDVDGSVDALLDVVGTYYCNHICQLDVIHYGIGPVADSDLRLAENNNAIIYSFNVKTPIEVLKEAKKMEIHIKNFNVIYELIDDMIEEINKLLPPKNREEILGKGTILLKFTVSQGNKKVPVAGSICNSGILKKDGRYRVTREDLVLYDGPLESLKHKKSEVPSINSGVECGIMFDDKNIEFKPGDTILCYELVDVFQKIQWNPGF